LNSHPPNDSGQVSSIVTAADELRAKTGRAPTGAIPVPPSVPKETPQAKKERLRLKNLADQYARPDDFGNSTFALDFPATFRRLTRFSQSGKVRWPIKGDPLNGDLSRVIKAYVEAEDFGPLAYFLHYMNDALAADFSPTWSAEEFNATHDRLLDEVIDREHEARPSNLGGKKPTDKTFRVEMIREAIGCMKDRAYQIDAEGTAILAQRIALAKAFANDPARCRPRDWEPQFKARGWGRQAERNFRRYVIDRVDLYEDDIGPALAMLLPVYEDGGLPDDFKGARPLVAALDERGIAIDARTALAIFDAFEEWKRPRRSRG